MRQEEHPRVNFLPEVLCVMNVTWNICISRFHCDFCCSRGRSSSESRVSFACHVKDFCKSRQLHHEGLRGAFHTMGHDAIVRLPLRSNHATARERPKASPSARVSRPGNDLFSATVARREMNKVDSFQMSTEGSSTMQSRRFASQAQRHPAHLREVKLLPRH